MKRACGGLPTAAPASHRLLATQTEKGSSSTTKAWVCMIQDKQSKGPQSGEGRPVTEEPQTEVGQAGRQTATGARESNQTKP